MKKFYNKLWGPKKEYLKPSLKSNRLNLIDDLVLLVSVVLALASFALLGLMVGITFHEVFNLTVK
jgi:hypothetical protein